MKWDEIIRFVEPVYLFCLKRLSSRQDAEDLAGEIILHVLEGLKRYRVTNPEAWVWRIAHNRYARFLQKRNNSPEIVSDTVMAMENETLLGTYQEPEMEGISDEYEPVFRMLHTLSSQYRDIMVDHYLHELSVKELAAKYSLRETTVKWRLNVSREKIRKRIGELDMEKIYSRINWNTTSCNGSMNPDRYLHSQAARAICAAAYEKPVTVEEISLATGIPTYIIEDELSALIYGDAIAEEGKKYAADFIILTLKDNRAMEKAFAPLVKDTADYFETLFDKQAAEVEKIGFYGCDFGMERLGYIVLPMVLREKIRKIKNSTPGLENPPYPPRKDGGYGWFIVEETVDSGEHAGDYGSGANLEYDKVRGESFCTYHICKYFDDELFPAGARQFGRRGFTKDCVGGILPARHRISDGQMAKLIQMGLVKKEGDVLKLNFPKFTKEQYEAFRGLFMEADTALDAMLTELVLSVHRSFRGFVPKRLDSQINQWVSCYCNRIIGYTAEELIRRGVLSSADMMRNGTFWTEAIIDA